MTRGRLGIVWQRATGMRTSKEICCAGRKTGRKPAGIWKWTLERREIVEEREINKRIAYLLFDIDTGKGESPTPPYFYFLRENDQDNNGWKITSYLDSTFHQELERAIESGEYSVPR